MTLYVSSAYRCPENSHYELCGSACPLTCMGLGSPVNCTIPCVETCTCDPGFVRSGSECVPSSQCGCSFNGHYVPAGEAFWADDACQRLCHCSMEGGHLECQDKGCGEGEHCQVENGIRDCYPVSQSTCMALGDPHYYTFDGNYFDFQVLDALKNCAIFLHNMFHAVYNNKKWRGKKILKYIFFPHG